MELIAAGRDAKVYEYAAGLVLRRYDDGRPADREAQVLRDVGALGYPVPAVHSCHGTDLVMERIVGPTLGEALTSGIISVPAGAAILAGLHDRLHALPWPGPEPLVHLDLHPLNVILGPDGPIVIDWSNARPGPAGLDVALTALVMAQLIVTPGMLGVPPAVEADLREVMTEFVREFAARVSTPYIAHLGAAEAYRLADIHSIADERRLLPDAVSLAAALGERDPRIAARSRRD